MFIKSSPFHSRRLASPPSVSRPAANSSEPMDSVSLAEATEPRDSGFGMGKALGAVALLGAAVVATGCTPQPVAEVETTTTETGSAGIDLSRDSHTGRESRSPIGIRSDGVLSHDLGNGTKIRSDGTVGFDMGNGTTINSDGSVDFNIGGGFSINSDGGLHYNF